MARFRNLLVHGYAVVDDNRVIEILQTRLEDLDAFLATGRMSSQEVADVRTAASEVANDLTRGVRWWAAWDDWAPPPDHIYH